MFNTMLIIGVVLFILTLISNTKCFLGITIIDLLYVSIMMFASDNDYNLYTAIFCMIIFTMIFKPIYLLIKYDMDKSVATYITVIMFSVIYVFAVLNPFYTIMSEDKPFIKGHINSYSTYQTNYKITVNHYVLNIKNKDGTTFKKDISDTRANIVKTKDKNLINTIQYKKVGSNMCKITIYLKE